MIESTDRFSVTEPVRGMCAWCGEVAVSRKTGRKVKYCSEKCKNAYNWDVRMGRPDTRNGYIEAARKRNWRRMGLESPPHEKRCEHCGERLHFQVGPHRFCGEPECQSIAKKEQRDRSPLCSVDGCDRRSLGRGLCPTHYGALWRKENPDRRAMIDHRRRSRLRGKFVEDVSRSLVLERDGWICHICGGPIPQGLEWPDPKYPTLDHVVPLAAGGEHSYSNCRASHWDCNSRKGDRALVNYLG